MIDWPSTGRVEHLLSKIRFGKFVSVGIVGAVCDTTMLVTLTQVFGVVPEVATLAGIETAILVMFAINEHWTFAAEGAGDRRSLLGRLKRSHVVRAVGSLTQFLVFVFVYRALFVSLHLGDLAVWHLVLGTLGAGVAGLAGLDLWLLVAKGTGIGIGMFVNYVAESLFTWRVGMDVE